MKAMVLVGLLHLFTVSLSGQSLLNQWPRRDTAMSRHVDRAFFTNRNEQIKPFPPDLHTQQFGFFCRQELKMQKAHIPVTFRVGTMEQCNWLEEKQGYR